MLNLSSRVRIFVALAAVDLRGSFDALAGHARRLGGDPLDGHLYVFLNARRTLMKVLWFDRNGWVIYAKRLETYVYDEVGNILRMKHQGGTEASPGTVFWHRGYLYDTGSNVLLKTSLPGDDVEDPDTYSATAYAVNDRGALVEMPHLAAILRQFDDQMRSVDLGSGDEAVYHYDAAGQRVRKVVRQGANTNERLYVGAWERFQRTTTTLQDERETLHVMDDRRRIVRIETLTVDGGTVVSTPVPRQRFQLGNHLESAALEVDEAGELLTYEEFHPYGTTAWWASNSALVSQKRYRYTGMERDEETGLQRHGVRGYAPWLGRWERVDPIGLLGGVNRWAYCRGNPLRRFDASGYADDDAIDPAAANDAYPDCEDVLTDEVSCSSSELKAPGLHQIVPAYEVESTTGQHVLRSETRAELGRLYGRKQGSRQDDVSAEEIHLLLDIAGVADPSPVSDGTNLVLYTAEGDYANASLSAIGMVPYVGDLAKIRRLGRGAVKALEYAARDKRWATAAHNLFGARIVGRLDLAPQRFTMPWSSRSGLGDRILDHVEDIPGTGNVGFEFNTTPWSALSPTELNAKIAHKLDQASADYAILRAGELDKVIWYGTEPLPTTGMGARLAEQLDTAGIEYRVRTTAELLRARRTVVDPSHEVGIGYKV